MKQICAIVSGGEPAPLTGIEQAELIIACDKGCQYLLEAGLRPGLLVGDFDSYAGPLPQGVPVLDLPREKDDTDTMAAVRYAVRQGYAALRLYCALGGRLDHLLGNLQAGAFAARHGMAVAILGARDTVYLLREGSLILPPVPGRSLSLLSLSDRCQGVCIRGVQYPLEDAELTNTFPIGVSNEWRGTAELSLRSGILAVILSEK